MKVEFDYGFGAEGLGGRVVVNGKVVMFTADYDKKKALAVKPGRPKKYDDYVI